MLDMSNTFTTTIPEHRARLKLTQEALANLVDVRRETIVFLEQGRYVPSLKLALAIAAALNSTVEQLFNFPKIKNN